VNVASWVRRIGIGRGRFDASVAANRLPAAVVRPMSDFDVDACCEIYELNQPGRFPDGYFEEFRGTLKSPMHLYLVIESAGKIIGLGGIYRAPEVSSASSLLFGLIHPSWHRQGFGSALLLARLSALPKPVSREWIFLSSIGGSETFYQRFGFEHYGRFPHPPKQQLFDCYRSYLKPADWSECSQVLARSNVIFDRTDIQVPIGP
jgi:[ribosomal protein S18]-alanine N-acetyltransferase